MQNNYFCGVDPINHDNNDMGAITLIKREADNTMRVVKCHVFKGKHPRWEKLRFRFLVWKYAKFYGKVLSEKN